MRLEEPPAHVERFVVLVRKTLSPAIGVVTLTGK
jgi:hypothetical protein